MKQNKRSKTVFANITIGFQMGITVSLFAIGGHVLDKKMHTTPWLLLAGAIIGMVTGFYHLIKELNALKEKEDKAKREDKDSNKSTKVKWM